MAVSVSSSSAATRKKLRRGIDKLLNSVTSLCEANDTTFDAVKAKCVKGKEKDFIFDFSDMTASGSGQKLTEEVRLLRIVEAFTAEVAVAEADQIPLMVAKMDRLCAIYDEFRVDELRSILKETTGNEHETMGNATWKAVVAATDNALSAEFSLAKYLKKTEQPKGVSRAVWMEHVKSAKKFAECFAHMSVVQRSGDLQKLDAEMAETSVCAAERWEEKYRKSKPLEHNEPVSQLVAYELIRRLSDNEYYMCLFCNTVVYNVKQYLSHFASGNHCAHTRKNLDNEGNEGMFAFADKLILNLTSICEELHCFYSEQYTAPIIESGAKVPRPDKDTIPTLEFLTALDQKYFKKICGNIDLERLSEPTFVAAIMPEIVKRHKSPLGKQLFEELHSYFENGKKFFCHRCRAIVSSRTLFYRHLASPLHLSMSYLDDGKQLQLMTVSVNLHMKDQL